MLDTNRKLTKVVGGPDSQVAQALIEGLKHMIARVPENERKAALEFVCNFLEERMRFVYDLNHASPKDSLEKLLRYMREETLWQPPQLRVEQQSNPTPRTIDDLEGFNLDTLDLSGDYDYPSPPKNHDLKLLADAEAQKYAESGKLFYINKGTHNGMTILFGGSASFLDNGGTQDAGGTGGTRDVGCTLSEYVNVKKAPEDLVLCEEGRQVVGAADNKGNCYFTRIFTHKNGRILRFYMTTIKDGVRSSNKKGLHVMMDDSPAGYHILRVLSQP